MCQPGGRWHGRSPGVYIIILYLREFVLTHVILTPGACGSEVRAAATDTVS